MLNVRRVDSNDRQIGLRISPDKPRRKNARVVQRYLKLARTVNDMAVRQDESISRDDEPGTATWAALTTQHADIHHRSVRPDLQRRRSSANTNPEAVRPDD